MIPDSKNCLKSKLLTMDYKCKFNGMCIKPLPQQTLVLSDIIGQSFIW